MAKGKGLGRPLAPSQEGKVVRERTNGIHLYLPYIIQDARNAKKECVIKDFWAPRIRQNLYRKLISIYFNEALLKVKDLDDMILDIEANNAIGLSHHKTLKRSYDLKVEFVPTSTPKPKAKAKPKATLEVEGPKQEVEASTPTT